MDYALFEKARAALARCLQHQGRLAVLTGAGVSKESGIPTFRDAQTGLWANFNPEDLATQEGFLKDPAMVWQWYDFRRNKVWDAQPNPGHVALVELETRFAHFTLITQNIDNLHRRAGSQNVLELHGNIFRYKCLEHNHPVSAQFVEHWPDRPDANGDQPDIVPRCPRCASFVRPDVVWFGEMLPEPVLQKAFEAAASADVMLVAGTSGVVHPAASLPQVASEAGATVIEVNPEMSALTPFVIDLFLQGPAGQILAELAQSLQDSQA